jgi:hypothetical protein
MNNTKYKFVQTTGCTAFDFTANGESLSDLSEESLEEILNYLLIKIKEKVKENNINLENVVELFHYDDYEHSDHVCEQCGDTVSSTTWNI